MGDITPHTMIRRKFRNELGNAIEIKIKNKRVDREHTGVAVIMIGPTSMAENNITDMEAVELYRALGKFIKQNGLDKN